MPAITDDLVCFKDKSCMFYAWLELVLCEKVRKKKVQKTLWGLVMVDYYQWIYFIFEHINIVCISWTATRNAQLRIESFQKDTDILLGRAYASLNHVNVSSLTAP